MDTMKAAMYQATGDPARVLRALNTEIPQPKAGEVRIQMKLSPIHNHDMLVVRGEYGSLPSLPATGGSEAVGFIDALGPGVVSPAVGTRVAVAGVTGAWAEYFIARATQVVPVPRELSNEIAAQLLGMPMSASMALDELSVGPGDWIAVNAANGAVGKSIAQLAKSRGIKVVNIVNQRSSREHLTSIGIAPVFSMDEPGWEDQVQTSIDGVIVGAIDMVGGEAARSLVKLVGRGGIVLSFGAMSNQPLSIDASDLIFKEILLKGFWGQMQSMRMSSEQLHKSISELIEVARKGGLFLPVHDIYELDEVSDAGAAYSKPRDGKLMLAA